jgi:type II secretory pathway pseudopilin PulG
MRFFSKQEIIVVASIIVLIVAISLQNFKISLRRARDAQRKDSVGTIANGLARYRDDFARFPLSSSDGKILACRPLVSYDDKGKKIVVFEPCEWGKDWLRDALDLNYPAYIETLPSDPRYEFGSHYLYLSNGSRFQIYAALEGEDEDEYDPKIVERGLDCGEMLCNFGRSSGVPLDKSIEEYENELLLEIQKENN